jgi:predicted extracellular nuclease
MSISSLNFRMHSQFRRGWLALLSLGTAGMSSIPAFGLEPGDVAIIGRSNNTTPDVIVFAALSDIPSGTHLYFTDNGWTGSQFRGASATDGDGSENLLKFTANSQIARGTVISSSQTSPAFVWTRSGAIPGTTAGSFLDLSLATAGDQIYVFEAPDTNPLQAAAKHLFAFDDTQTFEPATTSNSGAVPPGLQLGTTAVSVDAATAGTIAVQSALLAGERDKQGWLSIIANPGNWTAGALPAGPLRFSSTGGGGSGGGGTTPTPSTLRKIHEVQGGGMESPLVDKSVTLRGLVVGFVSAASGRDGFYLQEEAADMDNDPATSEGIFVHAPGSEVARQLQLGDRVSVVGTVKEFNGLTEIVNPTAIERFGRMSMPTPMEIALPVESAQALERYEGMYVRFPQTLTVSGNNRLGQYGELDLSSGGKLVHPTNVVDPNDVDPAGVQSSGTSNVSAVKALEASNDLRTIILDDADIRSWPNPTPHLSNEGASSSRRVGDTVTGLTGVLTYRFRAYRIDPVAPVEFVASNPRPATVPDVGGATLRVASANVLNYFLTLGSAGRGASNAEELQRQRAKVLASLVALRADVLGLMEVERRADNAALADLVAGLNQEFGSTVYAYVNSSAIAGTDAIQVALVYRADVVTPIGAPKTDTSAGAAVHNRPPLAQTFEQNATGERFTVVVNHFKSKSPGGATGADRDQGDGQGAYNATRKQQASQLLAFVANPVATFGDPDVLILGDLNAYAEEDPIDLLRAGGFQDQIERFHGTDGYSYNFDAQSGYLDHALANASMAQQITGVAEWHINADEPAFLNYNLENKSAEQRALNVATPYRSSDHDPLVIGVALKPSP